MKIALVNESSAVAKNALIYRELEGVVKEMGHEVRNYGMCEEEPERILSYVDIGYLSAILLNSKAVDFVVTGCSSGEGACMVANSYPNVYCGYIKDPVDAYLFGQINDGNAFSLAFNKDFGLGGELNLRYLFQTYFNSVHGKGYPEARASLQRAFQKDFARAKSAVCRDMAGVILQSDVAMTKRVCAGSVFEKHFFADCHDPAIADALRKVLTENE